MQYLGLVFIFADDAIVYTEIRSDQDCDELQKDLLALAKWEELWGMSFHPDKCNVFKVVRSKKPRMYKFHLIGHQLEAANTTKYLGVDISYNLSRNHHIDRTVKKGNSMLGFLKRNLKISNQDTKSAAYLSLVRPNLEYCASIWNPYSIQSIKKPEMVQRRAARYATHHYRNTNSVTDMLDNLEWDTLESRRTKIQLTMFFKIINDLVDSPSSNYLIPANSKTRSNHSKKMQQYHTRSDVFKYCFFPRTTRNWNQLPATIAETPDLVSFKWGLSSVTF